MFQVKHKIIQERERNFRPTKIKLLALGIQRFDPPLTRSCIDYATEEYKKITDFEAN